MKQCNVVKVGDSHAPIATWAGDVQDREESYTFSIITHAPPFAGLPVGTTPTRVRMRLGGSAPGTGSKANVVPRFGDTGRS